MNRQKRLITVAVLLLVFGLGSGSSAGPGDSIMEIKLTATDAVIGQQFGRDVGISGDLAVMGAPHGIHEGERTGAAYIFRRTDGNWIQEAKLIASDARQGDFFGLSVDISGETVVVGASHDDDAGAKSGAAYVFIHNGSSWEEQAKLIAADASGGDGFGGSVSIDGDIVVIGARFNDDEGLDAGAAYVLRRHGTQWVQEAKLTAGEGAQELDEFGMAVDVDGDTIVVGTRIERASGIRETGKAYVFRRTESGWEAEVELRASDGVENDHFGFAVAVRGGTIVVGAPRNPHVGSLSGVAYIFERNEIGWEETVRLTSSDAEKGDTFAYAVDITKDAQTLIFGAHRNDDHGSQSGAVYIFLRAPDGVNWVEFVKLTHSDGKVDDMLGRFLAADGDRVLAGAYRHNHNGAGFMSGAAYVFEGVLGP